MSSDTALVADVVTRTGLLAVRSAATLEEARARLDHAKAKLPDASRLAEADSALQLTARLAGIPDGSGATLFLAAETARDAVGAIALARALFLRVAREYATSSLAPRALLAAANLTPDSAAVWKASVMDRYGTSPYAQVLAGTRVSATALDADEQMLHQAWTRARAAADSSRLAADRRRP
jgi:hypothetical protein